MTTRSRFLMFMTALICTQVFFMRGAQAWTNHYLITKAALSQILELQDEKVLPTPFTELLSTLGYKDRLEFNKTLIIKKDYEFAPKLNETPGVSVRASEILAKYSDEPDWGMDLALFDVDQYPQLWKNEYSMMGGKTGGSSQGFRHMYWRGMTLRNPITTFKLPLQMEFSAMGQAPNRALDFIRLSRLAAQKGQRYWSLRFLACALHYIEDVSQPYHAVQTPTKEFIAMPFKKPYGSGKDQFVLQMQHIIEYYHHAFEEYIGAIMKKNDEGEAQADAKELVTVLAGLSQDIHSELPAEMLDGKQMAEKLATLATRRGARAGEISLKFFPQIAVPYATLETSTYMNFQWWEGVLAQGQQESENKTAYLLVVKEMFASVGDGVRRIVMAETRKKTTMVAHAGTIAASW
jgi:hypothetical protein